MINGHLTGDEPVIDEPVAMIGEPDPPPPLPPQPPPAPQTPAGSPLRCAPVVIIPEPTMEHILASMEKVDKDILQMDRVIKKVTTELAVSYSLFARDST